MDFTGKERTVEPNALDTKQRYEPRSLHAVSMCEQYAAHSCEEQQSPSVVRNVESRASAHYALTSRAGLLPTLSNHRT